MHPAQSQEQAPAESNIAVKLFVGCPLTPDIKMKLQSNSGWQQNKAAPDKEGPLLKEVRHQDKEYIGVFLKTSEPTLDELNKSKALITNALESFNLEFKIDTLKFSVFPKIFLS